MTPQLQGIAEGLMKRFSGLVMASCLVLLSGTAFGAETIKIGVAGAHSGDLASYGMPTANAARLVAKEVNAKGGIDGKQIELLIQDEECKPEKATNVATKLVSDGAVAVLGHICSGPTKAALPIYTAAKLVSISPSATSPELTRSGQYPLFFRTIAADDAQANLGADFAVNKLNAKKIALLHDKGDYGRGYAEFARDFINNSGKAEVVLFEGVTPGAMDYSAVVQKVRQSGADTVMFGGYHPEASKMVAQLKKKRVKVNFVSDDGVKDDMFIKVAGDAAEGVYASGPQDVSGLAMNKAAREAHVAEFGTPPGAFFDPAYAAMQALVNAIDKADSTDSDKIAQALRTELADTAIGTIKFDERGDAEGVGFTIYQVQNGKYVEMK